MLTTRRSVLNKEQMAIFEGLVLSDAHLSNLDSPISNSRFDMSVKYFGFANEAKKALPLLWSRLKHYDLPIDKRTGKVYSGWNLESKRDLFITEQRKRWYPNGKKIVPLDLKLTPKCLLWWYLGDGFLAKKPNRPKSRRVGFACDGFTDKEIHYLIDLLKEKVGGFVYEENKSIMISRTSLCRFIKIIGTKSPVPEYKYKFDFGQYKDIDYLEKSYAVRKSVQNFAERMRKLLSKKIMCIETHKMFSSCVEAAKKIGRDISSISKAALKGTMCAGKHWKYVKKERNNE